ncbi:MAG: hypothetical protein K0U47_04665 [Epsilonproteobacteria bacterium]|nr:hypothetical protein [Campylobacterota bacterium]
MKRFSTYMLTLSLLATVTMTGTGCGGSGGSSSADNQTAKEPDVLVATRIDNETGFINLLNASTSHQSSNSSGIEINPASNVFTYKDDIFMTESMMGDKIVKYTKSNDTFKESGVINAGEGSFPSSMIFVNDTKAYVALSSAGKLLIINPQDMTETGSIDLSVYAMDVNGTMNGSDLNPEPSSGIIRDGKLYMALFQVDNFQTFMCRGKASLVVIDIQSDEVLNHTTDDRTCSTGRPVGNLGIFMDENKDIYVNNLAGFGYYPGNNSGILRIKNGEDNFDPSYYFSITDLENLSVGDGTASVFTAGYYTKEGKLYVTLEFPSLASNPPDYVNDKNYQPFVLDLYSKSATKLDLPASNGWTTGIISYGDEILFGLSTQKGDGLFRFDPETNMGDETPYISTDGLPTYVTNY